MPPIYYLNPPPNPFWDFVADVQEHPFFNAHRRSAHPLRPHHPAQPNQQHEAANTANTARNASNQQANVEDPPEVDPSTLKEGEEKKEEPRGIPFRGRGRFARAFDEENGPQRDCRGRHGWGPRGRGRAGPYGFPPFFVPGQPGPFGVPGQHSPVPPPPPPPPAEGHPSRGHHCRRGGPMHRHGPPDDRPRHGNSPPRAGAAGFDLGKFLTDLGSRNWNEGLLSGLGRSAGQNNNSDTDFEPKADIFDRDSDYILHVSLPGAKRDDIGVDWDGEHSVLRIAGVVHRPGVDEKMLSQLAVDGRKREVGVFEKIIRLGTRRDPAVVDVAGIKAKMADGILIVTVPKAKKEHEKREVPIGHSQSPSPAKSEKQTLFDADEEMQEAPIETAKEAPIETSEVAKGKQAEYEAEKSHSNLQATVEEEQLPEYMAEEDHEDVSEWEQFGSDEEGEFVKINVD